MKTVLVVCTGNICRSPMGAALLRHHLAASGLADHVNVLSAGVWAEKGHEASPNAIAVLAARGVGLEDHRSQPVTAELLAQADLILVMEEDHRRSLFYLAPQHLRKVYLLSEMSGRHNDVVDPYGGPVEGYEKAATLLDELIERGLPGILRRIGIRKPADTSAA